MKTARFLLGTYNLWGTNRWPDREPALRSFLETMYPDILAVQELREQTRQVLDETLDRHARVDDPFEGWTREGNIYWRTDLFQMIEYGAEQIEIKEPLRRLFWVRLQHIASGVKLLVATAHFTWQGHPAELETHVNPRPRQAALAADALARLTGDADAVIFVGDFNESRNAINVLRQAGFKDTFRDRGVLPCPTHPAYPTARGVPQVLDWQLYKGSARVLAAEVLDFFAGDIAPSDHKPVLVVYEVTAEG